MLGWPPPGDAAFACPCTLARLILPQRTAPSAAAGPALSAAAHEDPGAEAHLLPADLCVAPLHAALVVVAAPPAAPPAPAAPAPAAAALPAAPPAAGRPLRPRRARRAPAALLCLLAPWPPAALLLPLLLCRRPGRAAALRRRLPPPRIPAPVPVLVPAAAAGDADTALELTVLPYKRPTGQRPAG